MFDLDREVAAWSAAVHIGRCQPATSVAELSDHLGVDEDGAPTSQHQEEEQ